MAITLRECEYSGIKQIADDIGNFDYAYEFICTEEPFVQSLIDWMSTNCQHNFIVTRTMTNIVAGGNIDNEEAWKNKQFTLSRMRFKRKGNQYRAIGPTWRIKMHKEDHVAFAMRWLDTQ